MSVLGLVVSFPLLVVSVALSAVPVWFAAKVVGAGRQEFWRVTLALVLAVVLAAVLMVVAGWKGLRVLGAQRGDFGRSIRHTHRFPQSVFAVDDCASPDSEPEAPQRGSEGLWLRTLPMLLPGGSRRASI